MIEARTSLNLSATTKMEDSSISELHDVDHTDHIYKSKYLLQEWYIVCHQDQKYKIDIDLLIRLHSDIKIIIKWYK